MAGLVLTDPASDDPWRIVAGGRLVRSSTLATGQPIPAVKTSGPLRVSDIPPAALQQMTAGLSDASLHANKPPRDQLPPDARRMRTWALGRIGHVAAGVNPVEAEELVAQQRRHAGESQPLRDLPLIVIVRGQPEETGPNAAAMEADHRDAMSSIAASSSRGRVVIADQSGHHVHIPQPELVTDVIRQVFEAAQ